MPLKTWNLGWLNHNSQRAYPLTDFATKADITGSISLPDDFLLSLYFPVHAGLDVNPSSFFLRALTIFGNGFNISLGYDDGSSDPPIVATATVNASQHEEFDSYDLSGVDDYADCTGKVVIGSLESINTQPPGRYFFDFAGGSLEVDCIRPMLRAVSSLTITNGTDDSERLYGDFRLVAGANQRITYSVVDDVVYIRFDAISGEGTVEDCACEGDTSGPCIQRINGIPPTADGNFTLQGDDCLEITGIANGLQLGDKCSHPCCGCPELEALTRELELLQQGSRGIDNFLARLQREVSQMQTSVLGSRLSDRGCL